MKKIANYISNDWIWQIRAVIILIIAGAIIGTAYLLLSLNTLRLTDNNFHLPLSQIDTIPTSSLASDVDVNMLPLKEPSNIGVLIERILPESPAQDVDLSAGDIIIAVDGHPINNTSDLAQIIATYSPGQNVTISVKRPGEAIRYLTVTLTEHYRDKEKAFLGVQYQTSSQVETTGNPDGDSPAVIQLVSHVITQEKLTQLAPFDILWPQDLPDGYQLAYIYEMTASPNESSGSGIFALEYVNFNDQEKPLDEQGRLFIWQYAKEMQSFPDYAEKAVIGWLNLGNDLETPIFESEEGTLLNAFLDYETVIIELSFHNMPTRDVGRIVSSLASD